MSHFSVCVEESFQSFTVKGLSVTKAFRGFFFKQDYIKAFITNLSILFSHYHCFLISENNNCNTLHYNFNHIKFVRIFPIFSYNSLRDVTIQMYKKLCCHWFNIYLQESNFFFIFRFLFFVFFFVANLFPILVFSKQKLSFNLSTNLFFWELLTFCWYLVFQREKKTEEYYADSCHSIVFISFSINKLGNEYKKE